MVSMTSEMASLDISIPPRTHCSAARSCGGVRSNSPPRGASSATLMTTHLPVLRTLEEPPLPCDTSVLAAGSDSLQRLAACVQSLCAQVCGQPVQTRRSPCARAGDSTEDKTKRSAHGTLVTSGNAVHRVCEEKTSCRQIVHTGRSVVHRRNVVMSLSGRRGAPFQGAVGGRAPAIERVPGADGAAPEPGCGPISMIR